MLRLLLLLGALVLVLVLYPAQAQETALMPTEVAALQQEADAMDSLARVRDFYGALNKAGKLLRALPGHADLWYKTGELYIEIDAYADAAKCFNKSLLLMGSGGDSTRRGWAYAGLATALYGNGTGLEQPVIDSINRYCRRVTQLKPKSAGPYVQIATMLGRAGMYDEALGVFTQLLPYDSTPIVFNNMAYTCVLGSRYSQAVGYARRGLAQDLEAQPALKAYLLSNLGLALGQYADCSGGMAALRQSMTLMPENPYAYYYMGRLLHAEDRWKEGCTALLKAKAIGPVEGLEDYLEQHCY